MRGFVVLWSCFMLGCIACKKETRGFDESQLIKPQVEGKYHFLEEHKLNLFLPDGFYPLNQAEVEQMVELIEDEKQKKAFRKALEIQGFLKVKPYVFIAQNYGIWLELSVLPHTPFSREEAGQVLYYINRRYDKIQALTGIKRTKLRSTFSANTKVKIVNVVYENIDREPTGETLRSVDNVYIIGTKKKTLMLILTAPEEVDFSEVISKIKIEDE